MGKAIAEKFAIEGASLILSGRDVNSGESLENKIREINDQVYFVPGDVTTLAYNKHLVNTALAQFGRLDIVSLNAGVLGLGNVTELSPESWHQTLDTNLSAIYYLCKHALPELRKTGKGNIIVNASIAAFKGFPNHPAYCASKAGAVALAKQMAMDYAPEVRVNAICPGPVDTPLLWDSAKAFENPSIAVQHAKENTLLKRLGKPEDIANLALFLASDNASWITGTAMRIDGGIMTK